MKRTALYVLVVCVVVFISSPAYSLSFDESDWSVNEAVIALNPDGADYVIVNRSSVSSTDVAYAALRALDLKNPGFIRSAAAEALSFMYEDGDIEVNAAGDDFVKTSSNFSTLNAGLRYEMSLLVQSLITSARNGLNSSDIQILVCGSCDPISVDLSGVPTVTASWYDSSVAETATFYDVDCGLCSPGETESAFCTNNSGGKCATGCSTVGGGCQKETFPLTTSLVDLTITHFNLRNGL